MPTGSEPLRSRHATLRAPVLCQEECRPLARTPREAGFVRMSKEMLYWSSSQLAVSQALGIELDARRQMGRDDQRSSTEGKRRALMRQSGVSLIALG